MVRRHFTRCCWRTCLATSRDSGGAPDMPCACSGGKGAAAGNRRVTEGSVGSPAAYVFSSSRLPPGVATVRSGEPGWGCRDRGPVGHTTSLGVPSRSNPRWKRASLRSCRAVCSVFRMRSRSATSPAVRAPRGSASALGRAMIPLHAAANRSRRSRSDDAAAEAAAKRSCHSTRHSRRNAASALRVIASRPGPSSLSSSH